MVDVPAAAREHSEEGAKAFARHYYDVAAQAYVTSDSTALKALSMPSCVGCGAMTRAVDQQASKGERFERPTLSIELVELRSFERNAAGVDVAGKERAVRILDKDGQVLRTTKPGVVTFRTDVVWREEGWRVAGLTVI